MVDLFWHRRDLRIPDNVGLDAAAEDGPVVPVFVVDVDLFETIGDRQQAFLFDCLRRLRTAYRERGADLLVRRGRPAEVLAEVRTQIGADTVYYNRLYRPARRRRQRAVADRLPTSEHVDSVLVDPRDLAETYHSHREFVDDWGDEPRPDPRPPLDAADLAGVSDDTPVPTVETDIDLPEPGYAGARRRYDRFLEDGIRTYADTRDDLGRAVEAPALAVSRLSPYLAVGTIGIRQLWADATRVHEAVGDDARRNVAKYRDELSWREGYYHLLEHHPSITTEDYDRLPIDWENDPDDIAAWQAGETGYPLVDAGMRQLEDEGYVHNRPRQIVASFLTKHLLTDWRIGADHFARKLLDHDPANNYGNWQWIAGTGTDTVAVRIFDPVAQMAKYDPDGVYVTEYVPELAGVPAEQLVEWPTLPAADRERLAPAYPAPIVDRDGAYERAQRRYDRALDER